MPGIPWGDGRWLVSRKGERVDLEVTVRTEIDGLEARKAATRPWATLGKRMPHGIVMSLIMLVLESEALDEIKLHQR